MTSRVERTAPRATRIPSWLMTLLVETKPSTSPAEVRIPAEVRMLAAVSQVVFCTVSFRGRTARFSRYRLVKRMA